MGIDSRADIIWRPGRGIFFKILYGAIVLLNHYNENFGASFKFG